MHYARPASRELDRGQCVQYSIPIPLAKMLVVNVHLLISSPENCLCQSYKTESSSMYISMSFNDLGIDKPEFMKSKLMPLWSGWIMYEAINLPTPNVDIDNIFHPFSVTEFEVENRRIMLQAKVRDDATLYQSTCSFCYTCSTTPVVYAKIVSWAWVYGVIIEKREEGEVVTFLI